MKTATIKVQSILIIKQMKKNGRHQGNSLQWFHQKPKSSPSWCNETEDNEAESMETFHTASEKVYIPQHEDVTWSCQEC